jgi:outer membrane protein OmpA-like peptidoglycan-associated protein
VAIPGAAVRYPGRELSPQLADDFGVFTTYELPPGEVLVELSHPDYEPHSCGFVMPESAPASDSGLVPVPLGAADGAASEGTKSLLTVRCPLRARPRAGSVRGLVLSGNGGPLAAARVELSGATSEVLTSGADGSFSASGLSAGNYTIRVEAGAHFVSQQALRVEPGSETNVQVSLTPKPAQSLVVLTAREVKIKKQVMFKSNSSEIDERSSPLLFEIADLLAHHPEVQRVQVQGHTDNRGDPAKNLELSQGRAEAVVRFLVEAGVSPERLEAKGYGDTRPLVPNLTPGNRARNRRVQFVIF